MRDNERRLDAKDANPAVELDDAQMEDVSGALPAVQTTASHPEAIGSQSSGAGAGKITFNPF
jgi:hypothetical protein